MSIFRHEGYSVRHWKAEDSDTAAGVVRQCLEAYGLDFEPQGADSDALEIENHYHKNNRGEFWVVVDEATSRVVGTAAYYELEEKSNGERKESNGESQFVEIRKMYLLPEARGKKLGRALLEQLENVIRGKGYQRVIVETATVLHEACQLYESAGYLPLEGVETERCDRRLYKDLSFS